jgi:uncharacterized repeat protein (TIGR03803 family)
MTRYLLRAASAILAALPASLILAVPAQAQTYTVVGILPSTDGPITNIAAENVVQGRNGDIYTISIPNGGIVNATTAGMFSAVAQPGGNGVTLGADGNFYSAVPFDRIGCGDVDRTTPAGVITQLASICNAYGNGPETEPIQAPSGIFYGTSSEIPSGGQGTIYSMTTAGALTLLHQFVGTDGTNPIAPLVVGSDGNFYGGTRSGGANNYGVLFRITPAGVFTLLHSFTGTDGRDLEHAMILGHDGNLYGTTASGGQASGVVFKLTNAGVYTVLYTLPTSLYSPFNSRLVQATDGKLYGLIQQGNSSEPGWIYSITTTGTFTILHEFCQQTNCTDGVAPSTPLVQHTDGKLYGFTVHGGDTSVCQGDGCGVLYSFDVGLKPFVTLVTTSGKVGSKIGILGQGFSAESIVKFNGVTATTVARSGSTFLYATVPAGASNGYVTVTTGSTALTSSQKFVVHDSWGKGTVIPTAVQAAATGVIGGKVYVVGGATNSAIIATNQVYSPTSNTWTTGAPMPTARFAAAAAVVDNILYVIGGNPNGSSQLNVVEAYNPVTNTWSTKASMPTARDSSGAVVEGGKIYVIGGYDNTSHRLATVESYDPATDTWATEASLTVAKSYPAAALLGTTIVAAGGLTNSGTTTGDNEGYKSTTNSWSTLTADPTSRQAPCNASLAGLLYSAGGSDSTVLNVNESFNLTTGKWTTLSPLPLAVVAPGSANVSNQLYCFGGSDNGNLFAGTVYNTVQIYQP